MEVNGEALQLHAVYKKLHFLLQVTRESILVLQIIRIKYYKSRENPYQVLQVMWESVSGTIYPAVLFKGLILLVNTLYTTMHMRRCPNNTLN